MGTGSRKRIPLYLRMPKVVTLTAAAQIRNMAIENPEFLATKRGNEGIWEGRFQPSEACATYLVRISALSGSRPLVWVLEPELRVPPDKWLEIHRFSDGGLCLHLHEQWTADQFIADTIVPWTSLWLINYEYWLVPWPRE
jgi:hypothetical protein